MMKHEVITALYLDFGLIPNCLPGKPWTMPESDPARGLC